MEYFRRVYTEKIERYLSGIKLEKEKMYYLVAKIENRVLSNREFLILNALLQCFTLEEVSEQVAEFGYRKRAKISERAVMLIANRSMEKVFREMEKVLDELYGIKGPKLE